MIHYYIISDMTMAYASKNMIRMKEGMPFSNIALILRETSKNNTNESQGKLL